MQKMAQRQEVFCFTIPYIPKILVIKSHEGTDFSLQSIYVLDYIVSNSPIKFEGYRDGISTDYDILGLSSEETTLPLSTNYFQAKFQNVDIVLITNQCD